MPKHIISYSTELMANFKQVTAITPQKKFHALQTPENLALLFSISNEQVLLITRQLSGQASGWGQTNISSPLSASHQDAPVIAKTFAVSQSADKQIFNLALVATIKGTDHLYLSLNNQIPSGAAASITVTWQAIPFDDPAHKGMKVIIENLHITQTAGEDYIVADVSRKTFPHPSHYLERYHIDCSNRRETSQYWYPITMGGDMEPDVSSAMGRKDDDEMIDGIYTLGSIGGKSQLLYTPLYNVFSELVPPNVTRLFLDEQATAIATARLDNGLTDLFVAAGQSIYHFAAGDQGDKKQGQKILANALFNGIRHLYAFYNDDKYVLWGLNRLNQIFYTSCKKENLHRPALWTTPLPILTNVHQVSPYINNIDSSSTFFAVAANSFKIANQSARTGLWDFNEVDLKAPPDAKAKKISSYTTLIQLTDDGKFPVPNTTVHLSTGSKTGVYINQLYYVLSPDPIPVMTDSAGKITLIQEVDDLTGAQLYVTAEDCTPVTINPMKAPIDRLAALDSEEKLKEATIKTDNGESKKLIAGDTSSDDLKRVAASNQHMVTAYKDTRQKSLLMAPNPYGGLAVMSMPPTGNRVFLPGVGWSLFSAIGDIFSYLASGIARAVNTAINFVKDTATAVWQLVVKIGDSIYHGILDCVETIVSAVMWVYDKVKTAIEDLIKFLEFLFQWKDIKRTKEVICNVTKITFEYQIKQIPAYRQKIHQYFDDLIDIINQWADLADKADKTQVRKVAKPSEGQSAPGELITYHYQQNMDNGQVKLLTHNTAVAEDLMEELIGILSKQAESFANVISQFISLLQDIPNLSIADLLKKIAGILAREFIKGVQLFVDVLFKIAEKLAQIMADFFSAPLYIPVVSDILNFFGIQSVSILDMLGWVVAVPATLAYKIVFQQAPFGNDQLADLLINTKELSAVKKELLTFEFKYYSIVPEADKPMTFKACHFIAGFTGILGAIFSTREAQTQGKEDWSSDMSTVLGIISGSLGAFAGLESPRHPIGNTEVDYINTAIAGLTLANKGYHFKKGYNESAAVKEAVRLAKVTIDARLAVVGLLCSCYHFYELYGTDKPNDNKLYQARIIEFANTTGYLGRISFTLAFLKMGVPYSLGGVALFNIASGGLHIHAAAKE